MEYINKDSKKVPKPNSVFTQFIRASKAYNTWIQKYDYPKIDAMTRADRSNLCKKEREKVKSYLKDDTLSMGSIVRMRLNNMPYIKQNCKDKPFEEICAIKRLETGKQPKDYKIEM